MSGQLVIATANTCFGRMIRTPNGLAPIAHADIILLQEVFNPQKDNLGTRLRDAGFTLLHSASRFGLVIALRSDSKLRFVPGSTQEHRLAKTGKIEQKVIQRAINNSSVTIERGLISCIVVDTAGQHITIATTHPTTPITIRPRARHMQIDRLSRLLAAHYSDQNLILGGDMNHYPKPKKVDIALHNSTFLTPVDLGNNPTWYARGSKQEKIIKLPAFLLRRSVDDFNGQHDTILYRENTFTPTSVGVVDIPSDHRAIVTTYKLR